MVERQSGRIIILQTLGDNELIELYTLKCALIKFVVDLIRDPPTSPI